jgi:hypothetical protein
MVEYFGAGAVNDRPAYLDGNCFGTLHRQRVVGRRREGLESLVGQIFLEAEHGFDHTVGGIEPHWKIAYHRFR